VSFCRGERGQQNGQHRLLRRGQLSRVLHAILGRRLDLQHAPSAVLVERHYGRSPLGFRSEFPVQDREGSFSLEDADRSHAHKLVRSVIAYRQRHPIITS